MKRDPAAARILVASDHVDDAAQVLRQLADEFEHVRASTDPDAAVSDFDDYRPDVLVLAFDALERAQRYYLGLYRLSPSLQQHPHRTVILCAKEEVRAVFELCKKDYFDDYVLYWPHSYDGPRLAMSVWIACREIAAARTWSSGKSQARSTRFRTVSSREGLRVWSRSEIPTRSRARSTG